MVRDARPQDLDAVCAIWLSGNLEAHAFVDPEYWLSHARKVREAIAQAEVLVYEGKTGQILGFLGLVEDGIEGLFVLGSCRGQGIGKALLDAAKRRRRRLTLSAYEKNKGALRFYRREGFVQELVQTDPGTGEREIRMRWQSQEG
ncbi:MAG: GNAT family N-acetyltransferase [Lachnospiraceae bacterium]